MLSYSNFEWLASSAGSLGFGTPRLTGSVAKAPVHHENFGLHTGATRYDEWEAEMLEHARQRRYTAIGLRDC